MPSKLNKVMRMMAGLWLVLGGPWLLLSTRAAATETPAPVAPPAPPLQVLISVPDQRLAVVRDGELVARFPVSTSRFGTGDQFWSYKTPLGELKICEKIGQDLSPGAVIRHRSATGEVLPANAPGRDPIVTRVIWLDGLETQNKNARARGIYIHGTPQENTIGTPTSYGCIRMRSKDVIKVFDQVPVGTVVSIIPGKLPHMHKYEPPKEVPVPAPAPEPEVSAIAAAKPAAEPAKSAPVAVAKLPADQTKPAAIAAAKPATEPAKPSVIVPAEKPAEAVAQAAPAPLPPIAEGPDHGSLTAWRALKGSFLLANIPGFDSDKTDDHRKKSTQ
jgi:lipoprotein-anchoring transpeptidase ErfK/SrfK